MDPDALDAALDSRRGSIAAVIALSSLGVPPPPQVSSDEHFRQGYYAVSYRFVKFLVARAGMQTFLKLYDSADPEAEYAGLYGASRQELVREAVR